MSLCADVRTAEQPGSGSAQGRSLSRVIQTRQVSADTLRRHICAIATRCWVKDLSGHT